MKKEELEEFILKYGTDLMKFCKITTNDDELAMELYQETMLRMVEHYKKLEVSENIKAWAISTAINLWKNKKSVLYFINNKKIKLKIVVICPYLQNSLVFLAYI